ncbi:NADH-quinone oxidoreductase subunit E [Pararhizobium haloflavum]|uniref:NADH-quinone oxidoreductase subunit E n=1 Tax=Pararhizobium haloflavum TaxID=2037914 RepID=UPI000C195764|nr:NADH-quinone oxidoreductase subunit E [Pararhizobium haloflavum]
MSVRRLAEDTVQPAAFAFSDENMRWAEQTIRKYPEDRQASAVIPLLMRAQEQEGWVTRAAIENIADMLGMPYIRALEVATFYTQFQLKPVGTRAHIQVCGTTPCMLRGSEELIDLCKRKINAAPFQTNPEGTLSWEEVECQGACVNAPMVMIFKDAYEDLTAERLEEIIDQFEAGEGAAVPPGPQNGRHLSAPSGGLTTLTDDEAIEGGKARKPSSRARGTGDEAQAPTQVGKPLPKTPPEADPQLAEPKDAKGPGGPSKTDDESGGEPEDARSASKKVPDPAVSGHSRARPSTAPKGQPSGTDRPDQPDDLKLISGIGPKIETKLNELGIWSYDQIAAWKKAEREWVDDHLRFSGRIERDDWIKQAKALAKGGEAEYIRVFGKKPR